MPEALAPAAPPSEAPSSLDPNAGLTLEGSAPPASPTPSSEPWSKGWAKDDGSFDHSRLDKLPDELKPLRKELELYKRQDDLLKSHKGLRELASKKGIAEPLGKDATPEQRAEHMNLVRRALGAPEKADGYVIAKPEGVPDNLWNTEAVKQAAEIAYKNGVSQDALKEFADFQLKLTQQGMEAQKVAEKEWFDGQDRLIRETAAKEGLDYAKARDLAERAGQRWGVDKNNPLMKNATAFMLLTRLGKAMSEDKLIQGETSEYALKDMNSETALKAADSIRDNKDNGKWSAYWNRDPKTGKEINHPDHDKVVAEVKRLTQLAHANRPMRK